MAIYSVTVAAPAAFAAATAPDVTIPFEPRKITIVNEDATLANYVEFSFDAGVNIAGRVTPTIAPKYECAQHSVKLWLKRAAGTPNVTIIAEA